jgi:hypothetical protein
MDTDVQAANEIYNAAQQDMKVELEKMRGEMDAVRNDAYSLGILKKIEYDKAHNEMLKFSVLHRIKEEKEYKKGGLTWKQFCEAIGESQRTVDLILKDIKPVVEKFSANFADLSGLPFSKIRYLGRSVSMESANLAENELVVDGTAIALTLDNKEEIEAAIDTLKETNKRDKVALQDKIKKLKKEKGAVVQEENVGLKRENEALISENTRLKVFDPKDKDRTWSVGQMKKVQEASVSFVTACRLFVLDERIKEDIKLQAEVDAHLTEAELALQELRRLWTDRFYSED